MRLVIKKQPTKELIPYANNARIHSAEQIDTIKASIEQFGFNDPVGVWTNKNGELEIVEGHGRVLAAQQLGIEEVPTINLDHLTDEERRAYSIVHNQTTDNSSFDTAILEYELENLDFEWQDFGIELPKEPEYDSSEIELPENWDIIVTCSSEREQNEKLAELIELGYDVRAVI